jgi:hypothetical protein
LYSGTTIAVPTAPLTAITNTSLLTCQSNRFVDNSSNNFAITRNGDVRVTAFSPFAPTSAYSTSVNGGSGYFDGSVDKLSGTSNAVLNAGTGAFTFETWFYVNSFPFNSTLIDMGAVTNGLQIGRRDSGANDWGVAQAGVAWRLVSTTLPTVGQWNHMVVVRNGSNNMSLFLNGIRLATTSTAYTFAQNGFNIGNLCTGYFSDTRYVVGTAVYDPTASTLTVPTAPLTAITNTSLLLNFTNAGIFDNSAKNNLETIGNAQVSTSVTKFGTGSMSFDGTGDRLKFTVNPELTLGSSPFTIECWLYFVSVAGEKGIISDFTSVAGVANGFNIRYSQPNGGIRSVFGGNATADAFNNAWSPSINTWYHFAAVRSGNSYYVFINGTQIGTTNTFTNAINITSATSSVEIGTSQTVSSSDFSGYIDDFRITKGIARYTANFTSPTVAFPDQ